MNTAVACLHAKARSFICSRLENLWGGGGGGPSLLSEDQVSDIEES